MSAASWNRKLHRWGSIAIAAPLLVVITTGILLQLKKEWSWVQPATAQGVATGEPAVDFAAVLDAARTMPDAGITSWDDIDRLDVRPSKGIIKVRGKNRWEVQVDAQTGAVVSHAYRRSDFIESLHDGSWFADGTKLWLFLPSAVILLGLWGTGLYLFALPYLARRRAKKRATS